MAIHSKILWLDGGVALLAGAFVLLTVDWLIDWYTLPRNLLLFIASANLLYGTYSLTLASYRKRNMYLLLLLVMANSIWSLNCLYLAMMHFHSASFLGLAHLIGESVIVGALAYFEWKWRSHLVTLERKNA